MKITYSTVTLMLTGLLPLTLLASPTAKVSMAGAGEGWFYPELGGHGIFLAAVDVSDLPSGMRFSAEFNTDTLRLGVGKIRFADGLLELGAGLAGEAVFAGLLPDYFRKGEMDKGRGFWAHYLAANVYFKVNLPKGNYLTLDVMGRKWFFNKAKETDGAFRLPRPAMVFEPRLGYTFWRLRGDASISDRHRFFRRIQGVAFGLVQKLELRSAAARWGAYDSDAFDVPDDRNHPRALAASTLQWLRAGVQFHPKVRTQFLETAMYGWGTDDLNRYRLGGMNPYVAPISGTPWAAFLSDRFVALALSLHVLIFDESEIGLQVDGAFLDDLERTGHSDPGFALGIAPFLDMRFGPYQLDVRAGWSPTMRWQSKVGQFSAFVAFGRSWQFQ